MCWIGAKGSGKIGRMKIGYARVSTEEQNLNAQMDALKAAGCDEIYFEEGVSGSVSPHQREGFAAAMAAIDSGDTLTVWKLDRLGRSLGDLIALMGELEAHGVDFQSLTDGIDTTTAGGKLVFHIMGALAEFERSLIAERTREGMKAAKRRGKAVGRPRALTEAQVDHAREMLRKPGETVSGMAEILGVDRKTLSRSLRNEQHLRSRT